MLRLLAYISCKQTQDKERSYKFGHINKSLHLSMVKINQTRSIQSIANVNYIVSL
jgi:hypothetical protein